MDPPTLSSTPLSEQDIKDLANYLRGTVDLEKALRCGNLLTSIRKEWSEGSRNHAVRELFTVLSKEWPELAEQLKQYLASATELNKSSQTVLGESSKDVLRMAQIMTESVMNSAAHGAEKFEMCHAGSSMAQTVEQSAAAVTRDINGVRIIANSMADTIQYYNRFMQITMFQGVRVLSRIGDELGNIKDELGLANSLHVQGSTGEAGFAQHVYDFVQLRIDEVGGLKHRFFVYHPDDNWYPAFRKLIRQNPLPPSFCAKSDDLDGLTLFMQSIRKSLEEESEAGKEIVFHLLIPAWAPIAILEPLHFPDDLYPLCVEGLKHQGKPYVALNFPAAPMNLFHGVANVRDPKGLNKAAEFTSAATWLVGGGWVLNGGALAAGLGVATLLGGGPFVAVPLWFAGNIFVAAPAAERLSEAVYECIAEEQTRILGSNERLPR
jgi:hypothetical protein